MDRLTMLKKATQLAHEIVDGASALSKSEHAKLSGMSDDEALKKLTKGIIEEAESNVEIYFSD